MIFKGHAGPHCHTTDRTDPKYLTYCDKVAGHLDAHWNATSETTWPDVIIRMHPMNRQGQRFHKMPTFREQHHAEKARGHELYVVVLTAWNIFQSRHGLLGLTVFRRWVRIFHPGLIVWVYNR